MTLHSLAIIQTFAELLAAPQASSPKDSMIILERKDTLMIKMSAKIRNEIASILYGTTLITNDKPFHYKLVPFSDINSG